jgi:hypothetical protein
MSGSKVPIVGIYLFVVVVSGCAAPSAARYVYQDHEFGVIAIPVNTSDGKNGFRAQAEMLMARHFPEGHEVVRAEEVIWGERTVDRARRSATETRPGIARWNPLVGLGKLARGTLLDEKTERRARECRIIYRRRRESANPGASGFAPVAALNPSQYVDPNEFVRKRSVATVETATDPLQSTEASESTLRKALFQTTSPVFTP